ncbi:hypothetical protein QBC46DRAFT_279743 [Diplogelasinospora grovesii]|uniref:Uncharacterized protein n=1 Tax=Diplogelasinospora grovesii TaxID=303347 RepID=A0AAN6NG29_9PEZI|nr:hypothetical protein QBC46DRAFT_279743 [Diplogelasinospora grovesii]
MVQSSHRKRVKRLLRLLKELQKDDYVVTAPTLVEARHLLQISQRCVLVTIQTDPTSTFSFDCGHTFIPRFILSQLEAQKLTDRSSSRVCISPPLTFILLSLSGSAREQVFPTLFRWHCSAKHRTYFVFAYIKDNMARRSYTINELLNLRGTRIPIRLSALANHPELVRDSGSESSGSKPLIKHTDDSSGASEEILYKGNMNRRVARDVGREATQEPVREVNHEPPRQVEWKYRGRSDSEATASGPLSAPGEVWAQKSEGFQRFYKAVVSPTHVRVTAGGRIVPNTRAPGSPTSKRSKDSAAMEAQATTDKVAPQGKPLHGPVGMPQPLPILMPPYYPGYPTGIPPIHTPMSFVPFPFGAHMPPGATFAQPPVGPSNMAQIAADGTLKDTHNQKPGENRNERTTAPDVQERVKISPPEFFDYTRPFQYNGQWMCPLPAPFPGPMGNPVVPVQMVGPHLGLASPMPGHMMQPMPNGVNHMMASAPFTSYGSGVQGVPAFVNHNPPVNANLQPPAAPPISSIKLSEITKKQIASFKSSLKYHEDQLQYNKHQIDERDMQEKIQTLQEHIRRFETTLKSQLEYEAAVTARMNQGKDDKNAHAPNAEQVNFGPRQPASTPDFRASPGSKNIHTFVSESTGSQRQRAGRPRPGINSNIGEGGKAAFEFSPEHPRPSFNDLIKKSGLPNDVALAPVFQPRGYSSSRGGSEHSKEVQGESERRPLAAGGWKPSDRSVENQQSESHRSTMHSETSTSGDGHSHSSNSRTRPNLGVPYLLGTLPKGMNPRTAKDYDYVYTRPLTKDEVRARFLYWGQAPKHITQGLPKFDGKHFYPPSPVKERNVTPSRNVIDRRIPIGRPEVDYDFRMTKSDSDPFRPSTPVSKARPSKLVVASEGGCNNAAHIRVDSYDAQVYSASDHYQNGSRDANPQEAAPALRCRENSADAASTGSQDRRLEKPGTKLWQTVLKKGSTSSAVSSTTAHGFLPQYSGYAAASLSPSFNKNSTFMNRDSSPSKMSDPNDLSDGGALLTPVPDKRRENRPPIVTDFLEDQLANLSLGSPRHDNRSPAFNI